MLGGYSLGDVVVDDYTAARLQARGYGRQLKSTPRIRGTDPPSKCGDGLPFAARSLLTEAEIAALYAGRRFDDPTVRHRPVGGQDRQQTGRK